MKKQLLPLIITTTAIISLPLMAYDKVDDEASLQAAITEANANSHINKIVFKRNAHIELTAPVIYNGDQNITLIGNGAEIDGAQAGSFFLADDLTAVTTDGTLIFNTAADVTIRKLTITNSATRGIVVNIPDDAEGDDIQVTMHKVTIRDSALYGVHIDDNSDEFDEGETGSSIGIDLRISRSSFTGNGTGAIDFDGVRVDERGEGDIDARIVHTHIDGNGGDGMELDEAGEGDVNASLFHVTLNGNGFYNEEDLDDGFDIDEAGEGNIDVRLFHVEANNNMDEGLDFDEEDEGDVKLSLSSVQAINNADEGIKVDEEDAGDIDARLKKVKVINSGDDGIQFTELGEGEIKTTLKKVIASHNKKYGIKVEQWFEEDEADHVEKAGIIKARKVQLSENGKGDEIKTNNVDIK